MMGSIAQRIKREQAEIQRWEQAREKTRAGKRWGMTFGMVLFLAPVPVLRGGRNG
jgi:hypothetical protein